MNRAEDPVWHTIHKLPHSYCRAWILLPQGWRTQSSQHLLSPHQVFLLSRCHSLGVDVRVHTTKRVHQQVSYQVCSQHWQGHPPAWAVLRMCGHEVREEQYIC
jgi:hypothetical protein